MYRIFHERQNPAMFPQPSRTPQPCGRRKTLTTKRISWQPWSAWVWCASRWSTAPSPRSTRWDLDRDEGWKQKPRDLFRHIFSSYPLGFYKMNRSTTKPGFQGGYALFWGQHFKIHGTTGFGQFLGFANFDPPQPWKTQHIPSIWRPRTAHPSSGCGGAWRTWPRTMIGSLFSRPSMRRSTKSQNPTNGLSRIRQDDHSRMILGWLKIPYFHGW